MAEVVKPNDRKRVQKSAERQEKDCYSGFSFLFDDFPKLCFLVKFIYKIGTLRSESKPP
jgi:hypothetical protein